MTTAGRALARRGWLGSTLLGGLLLVSLLLGLVSMHSIGHATAAPSSIGESASVAVTHHGGASGTVLNSVEHSARHGGLSVAEPVLGAGMPGAPAPTMDGCAGCATGHAGIALMCLFVLFLIVMLLPPRVLSRLWAGVLRARGLAFSQYRHVQSRAPSLLVLCISRT